MRKTFFSILAAATLISCSTSPSVQTPEWVKSHPEWAVGATIYELNTRQLTPEGTFKAAMAELPRIKELGVDIVWLMPIQPIGVKERKGSLGSYYAISDYTGFNPEFGTREDFEAFLAEAHRLGLKVILDWVANHTSPDHIWAVNDGWHKRDSLGEMKVKYDWTDISELEYENMDMRKAMADAMKFWADSIGVDGLRCDMAMLVPIDFWEGTLEEIRVNHPDFFMLAEAEEVNLTQKAFNAFYGWDLHHTLNALAQGKITADSLPKQLAKTKAQFPDRALRLNFTSNHDENSWAGSAVERMGDALPAMTALTYMLPGNPLIYNGQELGNAKRIKFFDKDTIDRVQNTKATELYRSLNTLRNDNPALRYGDYQVLEVENSKEIFAIERTTQGNSVIGIFNFTSVPQTATLSLVGDYVEVTSGAPLTEKYPLEPYGYQIFVSRK